MLLPGCFIACLPFCKHSLLDTVSWNLHLELRKSVTSNAVAHVNLSNVPLMYVPALSCWLRHHAGCSSTHLLYFHLPGKLYFRILYSQNAELTNTIIILSYTRNTELTNTIIILSYLRNTELTNNNIILSYLRNTELTNTIIILSYLRNTELTNTFIILSYLQNKTDKH